MFARSISSAQNMKHVQSMIRRSILRTSLRSSAQVHLASGSNRWMFSLDFRSDSLAYCASVDYDPYQSGRGRYCSAKPGSSYTLGWNNQYQSGEIVRQVYHLTCVAISLGLLDLALENQNLLRTSGSPSGCEEAISAVVTSASSLLISDPKSESASRSCGLNSTSLAMTPFSTQ
jgi:hypothetical protein